jgi:hypothetical protein
MRPNRIGRIQRQVRRLFIGNGGKPVRMAELLRHCYPRLARFEHWHRTNVRRAAKRYAVPIDRDGRGVVYGPSPELLRLIRPSECAGRVHASRSP